MNTKATDCDYCSTSIPYGVQCWMIRRGVDQETKKPLVKIACQSCYENGIASP